MVCQGAVDNLYAIVVRVKICNHHRVIGVVFGDIGNQCLVIANGGIYKHIDGCFRADRLIGRK